MDSIKEIWNMSTKVRDVDEAILCHAAQLLSTVRRPEPEVKVDILEDVPRLLVYLFERVTTEEIPEDMKPFDNFRERSETLQRIINTLEETLGLSLSHVSGSGLVLLDRRQLADMLEIFDDLVQHCLRSGENVLEEHTVGPADARMTMSLLESPEPATNEARTRDRREMPSPRQRMMYSRDGETMGFSVMPTGPSRQHYPNKDTGRSPVVEVRPMRSSVRQTGYDDIAYIKQMNYGKGRRPPTDDRKPDDTIDASSTKSSTTLVKEYLRGRSEEPTKEVRHKRDITTKQKQAPDIVASENVSHPWFTPELRSASTVEKDTRYVSPCYSRKVQDSPVTYKDSHAGQDRYEPYRKDRSLAKGMKSGAPVKIRKPSVKSFRQSRRQSVSVPAQKKTLPTKPSLSRVPGSLFNKGRVQERGSSVISRSNKTGNRDSRVSPSSSRHRPSIRSVCKGQGQTRAAEKDMISTRSAKNVPYSSGKSVNRGILISPSVSARKHSTRSVNIGQGHSNPVHRDRKVSCRSVRVSKKDFRCDKVTSESHASIPVQGRKRAPSVVSTKVRKHSSSNKQESPHGSKRRSPVKRGHVSPQTTSLASSLKLLEEFDYVHRRLKEIKQLRQEHLQAIIDLDREKIRLEAVLSHVHLRSSVRHPTEPLMV